mgnify:CR=1 FL=1
MLYSTEVYYAVLNCRLCHFDLINGTIVDASKLNIDDAKIEDYGNGWFRCSIVGNNTNSIYQLFLSDSSTGTPTGTGNAYIYGSQFEQLSYTTSYIPTNGSTVTRNADAVSKIGLSNYINSSEGVLYLDCNFKNKYSASRYISIGSASNTDRVIIGVSGGSDVNRAFVFSSSVEQAQLNQTIDLSQDFRLAISFKENEVKFFSNGEQVGATISSATMPIGMSVLGLDGGLGAIPFYGEIKDLRVYNTTLTDVQLQALTL